MHRDLQCRLAGRHSRVIEPSISPGRRIHGSMARMPLSPRPEDFRVRPLLEQPHGKVLFAGEHIADCAGLYGRRGRHWEIAAANT